MQQDCMMARLATEADIPDLLEMGARFHAKSGAAIPYCRESVAHTLRTLLASDDGVIFMDGAAAAGALLHGAWFNQSHKTGSELFWWSENGAGQGLFAALEDWAKEQGADSFAMVALEALRPAALGAVYKRKGYRASEHSWLKVF
jgi:hypothetical protein